ncbi:site-specific integrase [Rhodococcus zopfii]|uniref:site-specific integrase n=1 Tax=Rhodococcus zopfii TaxID=43772 RepID=UPI0035287518
MFLAHLTVIERSPTTVHSYAFDLRDYFRFLGEHQIDWTAVTHDRDEQMSPLPIATRRCSAWIRRTFDPSPGTPAQQAWARAAASW